MKTIILDTNFVLVPFSHKVDVFEEIDKLCDFSHELVVFEATFDELNTLIMRGGQTGNNAKAAIQLLNQKRNTSNVNVLPGQGHVDDLIVDYANKHSECIVATMDSELKKRLSTQFIVLRQQKYLQLQ